VFPQPGLPVPACAPLFVRDVLADPELATLSGTASATSATRIAFIFIIASAPLTSNPAKNDLLAAGGFVQEASTITQPVQGRERLCSAGETVCTAHV
jgi:hypothetical protein